MSELSRRTLLAGVATAAAMPLAASRSAHAAAPPSGKQAPGYYRYRIGDFELTAILDGVRRPKLEASPARNAKLEDVQALLEASRLPKDQLSIYFHPTVINTGAKLILIDTGNGPGSLQAGTGQAPANIAAAGIDPKTVDIVIISHFHGDHISGLRTADGALAYPNAEIKVPATEWAFWSNDANAAGAPQNQQATFQNVKRIFGPIAGEVTKYEWGKEVAPGITALDDQRTYARPYLVRRRVRIRQGPDPGRRHRRLRAPVRHQSRLARRRRHGRVQGRADPAQALRHAGGGAHAALGLPLPISLARLHREGRHRLPPGPGELEPGAVGRASPPRLKSFGAGKPSEGAVAGSKRQVPGLAGAFRA